MNLLSTTKSILSASYSGIRREVWWLSLIMLINRSGSMVFPFLSLYLIRDLNFSELDASLILTLYGIGSMIGALIGGYLTDRYGSFWVQFVSLILSGIGWLILVSVREYTTFLILIPLQSIISDAFRPANIATITKFTNEKAITKSYSLNRMAMNLGYSIGPAMGGILAGISFSWLFISDGITCISAGLVFFFIFRRFFFSRTSVHSENKDNKPEEAPIGHSPYMDFKYLIFIALIILFAMGFFQLLFTLPLYYSTNYGLKESMVGYILAANGVVIVFSEMVFVHVMGSKYKIEHLILWGLLIVGVGFLMLNFVTGIFWLFVGMIILSFGEMMTMPFMQTYVARRAHPSYMGSYMALYSFAYSVGLILAPFVGMRVMKYWGFDVLWSGVMCVMVVIAVGFMFLFKSEAVKDIQPAN